MSNDFFDCEDTPEGIKAKAEHNAKVKAEMERIQTKKKAVAKAKREAKLRQQAIDNLSPKSTVTRNSDGKVIGEY